MLSGKFNEAPVRVGRTAELHLAIIAAYCVFHGAMGLKFPLFPMKKYEDIGVNENIIIRYAGSGSQGFKGDGQAASLAQMYLPQGTVVDSSGNLYIADSSNHRVRMVAGNSSIVSTYAGGGSGIDGSLASQASLGFVSSITMDSSDNLFIADVGNHRVRFVVRSPGIITSYAGNGGYGYTGDDGPATLAQVGYPRGLALDSYGNLYISDDQIHRVRVVKKDTGIITTYAGNGVVDEFGTSGYSGDGGAATLAQLNGPQGLAVDIYNNLYIADTSNHVIRVVSANTGIITTIAGNGFQGYSGDGGLPRSAKLYGPTGVTVDPSSFNIFIADTFNNRIRMISNLTGIITTVAGNGNSGSSGDGGDAKSAQIYWPYGVSLDLNGNLIVADTYNNAVRLVTPKPVPSASPTAAPTIGIVGDISTYAGSGVQGSSGDGGPAKPATLTQPSGIAMDSSDNLYIVDYWNNKVRIVTMSSGIITTYAGKGGFGGYSGDGGAATQAALHTPWSVAVTTGVSGDLYIADSANNRVRLVVRSTGIITTYAGNGAQSSYSGDQGPATLASLPSPVGLALDDQGNLYISSGNQILLVVKNTGIITAYAGIGTAGWSGDGGPAVRAQLNQPHGLAVSASGDLYIADYSHIRIVSKSTGAVSTYAGNGNTGSSGDGGPATSAQLNSPQGVAIDAHGNLYIADSRNCEIRLVNNRTGVITKYAGSGTGSAGIGGYSGDGYAAVDSFLSLPAGVAFDSSGNVYIADQGNNRIRFVQVAAYPTMYPTLAPSAKPTRLPSPMPSTISPTTAPRHSPTLSPVVKPNAQPTVDKQPTAMPADSPIAHPTSYQNPPSYSPTIATSPTPTSAPTTANVLLIQLILGISGDTQQFRTAFSAAVQSVIQNSTVAITQVDLTAINRAFIRRRLLGTGVLVTYWVSSPVARSVPEIVTTLQLSSNLNVVTSALCVAFPGTSISVFAPSFALAPSTMPTPAPSMFNNNTDSNNGNSGSGSGGSSGGSSGSHDSGSGSGLDYSNGASSTAPGSMNSTVAITVSVFIIVVVCSLCTCGYFLIKRRLINRPLLPLNMGEKSRKSRKSRKGMMDLDDDDDDMEEYLPEDFKGIEPDSNYNSDDEDGNTNSPRSPRNTANKRFQSPRGIRGLRSIRNISDLRNLFEARVGDLGDENFEEQSVNTVGGVDNNQLNRKPPQRVTLSLEHCGSMEQEQGYHQGSPISKGRKHLKLPEDNRILERKLVLEAQHALECDSTRELDQGDTGGEIVGGVGEDEDDEEEGERTPGSDVPLKGFVDTGEIILGECSDDGNDSDGSLFSFEGIDNLKSTV